MNRGMAMMKVVFRKRGDKGREETGDGEREIFTFREGGLHKLVEYCFTTRIKRLNLNFYESIYCIMKKFEL